MMNSIESIFHWLSQNPSAAAIIFFASAIVGVVLYGYLYKFDMLTNRD